MMSTGRCSIQDREIDATLISDNKKVSAKIIFCKYPLLEVQVYYQISVSARQRTVAGIEECVRIPLPVVVTGGPFDHKPFFPNPPITTIIINKDHAAPLLLSVLYGAV
jgi:hypothetical protein